MEGVLVAVKKNGEPYGEFHFMETVFHLGFEKYTNDTNISGANGTVLFYQNTHPRIYVQPVGHGVKAYDGTSFEDDDGVIYYYRAGNPTEPPPINNGQTVTAYYDLVPISDELWNRRFDFWFRMSSKHTRIGERLPRTNTNYLVARTHRGAGMMYPIY